MLQFTLSGQIGDGLSVVTPIKDGAVLRNCIVSSRIAGRDITRALCDALREVGVELSFDSAQRLKEMHGAVRVERARPRNASDVPAEMFEANIDGVTVSCSSDVLSDCAEVLFDGVGDDALSLPQLLQRSIALQRDAGYGESVDAMLMNVVLAGGTTMLTGLRERLEAECNALLSEQGVCVVRHRMAATQAWLGARDLVLAADNDAEFAKDFYFTRAQYDEKGVDALIEMMRLS